MEATWCRGESTTAQCTVVWLRASLANHDASGTGSRFVRLVSLTSITGLTTRPYGSWKESI